MDGGVDGCVLQSLTLENVRVERKREEEGGGRHKKGGSRRQQEAIYVTVSDYPFPEEDVPDTHTRQAQHRLNPEVDGCSLSKLLICRGAAMLTPKSRHP